jgi:hypothetical protein
MIEMTALERSGFVRTYGQPTVWADYEYGEFEAPGRDHRQGVCSDHMRTALELPGTRLVEGVLAAYVVDDAAGGVAYPVTCGDLIEIRTEDGLSDGRCGLLATDREAYQCEGHAAERRAYMALTEAERAHLEREEARLYG